MTEAKDISQEELSDVVSEEIKNICLNIPDGAFVRIVLKKSMYLDLHIDIEGRYVGGYDLKEHSTENNPNFWITEVIGRFLGHPYYVGEGYFDGGSNKDVVLVNPFNYIESGLGHDLRRTGCVRVPLNLIKNYEQLGSAEDIEFKVKSAVRQK